MRNIFSMDNPFMQALDMAADLMLLNLLTLLCSIPIVTAGAAITALNDQIFRLLRQEEDSRLARGYFRAFRANLKKGSLLGLLCLAAALVLYVDFHAAETYLPLMRVGVAAIAILCLAVALYAFALLARYENTLRATLKNACSLAVAWLPRTVGMLVCTLAIWLLALRFVRIGGPLIFLFGLSLPCYICMLLMKDVFNKLEE